jgi:hypothetical protein
MFIGDYNNDNLYHFKLNQSRTGLVLSNSLADKIASTPEDAKPLIFDGFDGGITDLPSVLMAIYMFLHLRERYIE